MIPIMPAQQHFSYHAPCFSTATASWKSSASDMTQRILRKWREQGQFIRFVDGNVRNCAVTNLEFVSLREAMQHVHDWKVDWDGADGRGARAGADAGVARKPRLRLKRLRVARAKVMSCAHRVPKHLPAAPHASLRHHTLSWSTGSPRPPQPARAWRRPRGRAADAAGGATASKKKQRTA